MSTAPEALSPPHVRVEQDHRHLERAFLWGTLPIIAASVWLHGPSLLWLFGAAAVAALAGEWIGLFLSRGARRLRPCHALATGLLLVLVVDAHTSPFVVAAGGFGGALIARLLRDRWGTYVWHPAALATVAVLLGMRFAGPQVEGAPSLPTRPIDQLMQAYDATGNSLTELRDVALYELPAWRATLTGHVAGGAGETCTFAILAGGLWLIVVRNLRWHATVCAVLAAGAVAAVWPIRGAGGDLIWLPIAVSADSFPVGMTLVMYHLTGGGLVLASTLFAADTVSTPLNARGHAVFGAGLGALTIALRALGISLGACWWALLAMNTLVPVIDRVTRRRVWGT